MKQKRPSPEAIIRLLRESDSSPLNQKKLCQQKQISVPTLQRWRKKYGQMDEADANRQLNQPGGKPRSGKVQPL